MQAQGTPAELIGDELNSGGQNQMTDFVRAKYLEGAKWMGERILAEVEKA